MHKLIAREINQTTLDTANALVDAIQTALIARNIGVTGVAAEIETDLAGKHELRTQVYGMNGIQASFYLPLEAPVLVVNGGVAD